MADDGEWGTSVTDDGTAYWYSRVTGEISYVPPVESTPETGIDDSTPDDVDACSVAPCAHCADLRAHLDDERRHADALTARVAILDARLAERDRELTELRAAAAARGATRSVLPPPSGAALHLRPDTTPRTVWHGAPLPAGDSSSTRSQPGSSRGGPLPSGRSLRGRSDLSDATWVVLHDMGLSGAMVFT